MSYSHLPHIIIARSVI